MNAPIIDLRTSVPLHRRLPAGLGTLALWTLWGAAVRHGLGALVLGGGTGSLLLLGVHLAMRLPRRRPVAAAPPPTPPQPGPVPGTRQALGQPFGLSEVELFRAQHSRICTVFHDEQGAILRLVCHLQGNGLEGGVLQADGMVRPERTVAVERQGGRAWMEACAGRRDAHPPG